MARVQKITPCLWFDDQAEEAAEHLHRHLPELKDPEDLAVRRRRDGRSTDRPPGSVMAVDFELDGQALHRAQRRPDLQVQRGDLVPGRLRDAGGDRLLLGQAPQGGDPKAQQCGWLKDKYGLSWQVVPAYMSELFGEPEVPRGRNG